MRFHKGTYGKETVESNSLVANLLKYPEIASVMIKQYPQYSLNYFVDGTNKFAKEEMIGENAFRWTIMGRLNRPSTCTGVNAGNGANNTTFTVEFEENYLNPNDDVLFPDGNIGHVMTEPTQTAGGYTYTFKLATSDANAAVDVAGGALSAGKTVGTVGNSFPEGSDRGFENHVYPDWYINHTTTSRKSKAITGSALTDVTWIENNGQRLWFFTDEVMCRDEFMYQKELDSWYGKTTMDLNGNPTLFDAQGRAIVKGDGVLAQIDGANTDTYSGQLTEDRITDFLAQLSLNTGNNSATWVVHTGTAGRVAFHRAMKDLVMPGGNFPYSPNTGGEQKLGVNFTTYSALGSTIVLAHNPLFDDPHLHGNNIDPATGYPKESSRMVFLNQGSTNGVSNIERKVKGAGGINRGMITKYIAGMVDPFDQKSMRAANARDAFSVEYLCESGMIVRNPLSCGQLKYA
jgi:hypothetical protein